MQASLQPLQPVTCHVQPLQPVDLWRGTLCLAGVQASAKNSHATMIYAVDVDETEEEKSVASVTTASYIERAIIEHSIEHAIAQQQAPHHATRITHILCILAMVCRMNDALRTAHYILRATYYALHTTYYALHTTYYALHTAYYILRATHYILRTTHCILHTTHYILRTAYYALHTTYYILRTTHYILRTAHCTLYTTRYILHTAYYTITTAYRR